MDNKHNNETRSGETDLSIPLIGIGAWSWGDRILWGFGQDYQEGDVHNAFKASLNGGITFFDTAEVYGLGRSERLLGSFIQEYLSNTDKKPVARQNLIIATKFFPYPWRLWKGTLIGALKSSLERLKLDYVDLYQIHMPVPPIPIETWAEGLAEAVKLGLAKSVGVSNYNEQQMRQAYSILAKYGIQLASNQVEYHLLNRGVEFNGLLDACQELGIALIAYSPLAKGMLTGKYSPTNVPPGVRRLLYNRNYLAKIQPLLHILQDIGDEHDGKTLAQVALNWLMFKGATPIPGAKNERQALENSGALGWRLSEAEVAVLDKASQSLSAQQ